MDRQIIYPGQIPLETDLLKTNKNVLTAVGLLVSDLLGTATTATGFACTQLGTPALSVQVAPGRFYSLQNLDGTAYSSLAADTAHQIVKQGILLDAVTLACAAPSTAGFSVNYLIEASYQDLDGTSVALPYYNASNPTQAYTGPANSGTSQPTVRAGAVVLLAKAGVAAATGSQVTPAPDSSYAGLWVVTVANGQSSVLNANISAYAAAPFFYPIPQRVSTGLAVVGNGPWANPASGDTQHLFELVNDNGPNQGWAMSAYGVATNGNNMHWNRYFGTLAAPTAVQTAAYFMSQGFRGWDGSGTLSQSYAAHQVVATENWGVGNHGIKFHWEVAPNGAGNPARKPVLDLYSGLTDGVILAIGDGTALTSRIINNSTTGAAQIHGSSDQVGAQFMAFGSANAGNASQAIIRGSQIRFQSVAGSDELIVDASGNLLAGATSGSTHTIYKTVTNDAGNAVLLIGNAGNASAFYGVTGSGANAANAGLRVLRDATTLRSINAAGTINASGADYAEYMVKAPGCSPIAKGGIVGVDANGQLTDKWADAITFVVKSTNPSYVGADVWGHAKALGIEEPVEPVFTAPVYDGAPEPGSPGFPEVETPEEIERYRVARCAYEIDNATFQVHRAEYATAVAAAEAKFHSEEMAAHQSAMVTFRAAHDAARAEVDRIAFSGRVPVNVLGATPGDYIVPAQDGDGIKGVPVSAPSFEEYRSAVGRVIAIEDDGRACIIVKAA